MIAWRATNSDGELSGWSVRLIQLERQLGRNATAMTKIVKKILLDSRITAGQKRRLEKLSERSDEEIDTSDIPELTEKFWQNAVRNPFYRPVKQQLTLRLDADIIAWLRSQGKGYQTRANALLRTAMLRDFSPKQRNPRAQTHQAHREESRRTKIGRARQVS